jgi:hypothetical protein
VNVFTAVSFQTLFRDVCVADIDRSSTSQTRDGQEV